MIAFLLLATGAQGAALPPAVAPEIVQARLAGDTWFVPVSIGGKTGDFVLATGVAKSSVDPDFATAGEGASLEPRIGSISLGPLRLISRKTFNAKGIIGADVLADRMVGFDFDTGQLALWPKGTKPLSARGWIEALPGAGTPRIQPIGLLETGVPTISMILGGEPGRFRLSTGVTAVNLLSARATPAFFTKLSETNVTDGLTLRTASVPSGILGPLVIGGGLPRYVRVRVEDKNNDEKVDGSVPLSALGSRRAVLDIATRSLLVESRDADGELASSLSAILGVAVALKGDALILGVARDPGFAEALKPFIDSPVTSIDGKAGAEIAKELRRGGAATLKIMSEMQRARAAGYTMLIETRFGPRQLLMPKG